ncbi:MAG TPA: hypothetical protein VEH62_11630 [Gemmatimonadales bacterium]|nr:hypothetical protein [Gemmatimonadales bacterium]
MYDIAVVTSAPPHLSVEVRLTTTAAESIALSSPAPSLSAGTDVEGLIASDDRGRPLRVQPTAGGFLVAPTTGAVRFRYRLDFQNGVALSSTGSGLNAEHLYAVARGMFVAPDPASYDDARPYPLIWVHFVTPPGWHVVTGWGVDRQVYVPSGSGALLGATVAAAPDYRILADTAGGTPFVLAVRGQRHFADSTLERVVAASLRGAAALLGGVPVPQVTYTADVGSKGRTSGSLQGRSSVGLMWEPGELLERARTHDVFHETLHLWFGGAMEADRWWTEGVTDYFAALLEAQWSGRPADLADLCYQSLRNYRRIVRDTSITMAEEQRENVLGDNTTLLVYRKGMLAGLLLDAAVRRATEGEATLADVARRLLAIARLSPSRLVDDDEIRDAAVEVGGEAAGRVWRRVVAGTSPITEGEVTEALRAVTGLPVTGPAPVAKEQKVLIGHPKP